MASVATKMAVRGNMHMNTRIDQVIEFNSEVRYDLWGHLKAAIASDLIKMAVRGNMHTDTRVIKVSGFKSKVKLDLWVCLEATKAFEATRIWT